MYQSLMASGHDTDQQREISGDHQPLDVMGVGVLSSWS
jgi:hypothetical protein